MIHRLAQRELLRQRLTAIDWDEIVRWAEELTAALTAIILAPRALLTARIHNARSRTMLETTKNNLSGPTLRPGR